MWTYYQSSERPKSKLKNDFLFDKDPLSFVNQIKPKEYESRTSQNTTSTTTEQKSQSWFKPEAYNDLILTTSTSNPVVTINNTANTIMSYLKNKYGFTDESARAFAGQVYRENGFRINAVNEDEKNNKNLTQISRNGGYGAGLIQFTGDLKKRAEELLGKKVEDASLQEQLSILEPLYLERNPTVWNELKTTHDLDRALDLTYAGLVAGGYSADEINEETRKKLINKYKLTHQRLGYKNIYDTWQRAADWAKNYKTS